MKIILVMICCFLLIAVTHCNAQEKTEHGLQEIKNATRSNALISRPKRRFSIPVSPAIVKVVVSAAAVAEPAAPARIATASTITALVVAIQSLSLIKNERNKRDVDLCLSSRASKIGTFEEMVKQLFEQPEVKYGVLKKNLHYEETGAHCDGSFCRRYGDGKFGFGICSRQYCHCANNTPSAHECGEGTVYDPFAQVCNLCQNVKICAFWSSPNQLWEMKHDGTIARQNTNKCVDNKDWSTENGTPIQQWDCGSTSTVQQWKYEPAAGYTDRSFIMNIHSRKCMQIKGISQENGAQIEQWECNFQQPHPNQLWKYVDGHFLNDNSGKCLDAPQNSLKNGIILQQWDCY